MFQRRLFSTSTLVLKNSPISKTIPKPTKEISDVASFLNHIGRNTSEFNEAFPTWESLFTSTSKEMKAAGIDAKPRKYILEQVERYRKTAALNNNNPTEIFNATKEIKLHAKKHGGERNLNKYLAQKRILERIELAKTQKQYRKSQRAIELKYKQLNRLHEQAGHTL